MNDGRPPLLCHSHIALQPTQQLVQWQPGARLQRLLQAALNAGSHAVQHGFDVGVLAWVRAQTTEQGSKPLGRGNGQVAGTWSMAGGSEEAIKSGDAPQLPGQSHMALTQCVFDVLPLPAAE